MKLRLSEHLADVYLSGDTNLVVWMLNNYPWNGTPVVIDTTVNGDESTVRFCVVKPDV